ncbi:MAG: Uma2 family endonuclease [Planctomycetota bacterium]
MAQRELSFTRADYDRLPEDLRVELIDGKLLKMASPTLRHQGILQRLFLALLKAVEQGRVYVGPVDFHVDDRNALVPDLVVLPEGFSPLPGQRGVAAALLVGEVLSPSTSKRDRTVKTKRYLGAGVKEVWLLDPEARTIEIRTPAGERRHAGNEMARSDAVPGFQTTCDAVFSD